VIEFDHLFICVDDPGVGDLLRDFGLSEGSSNTHLGQGTANRRFFFNNGFIELLYSVNKEELQSSLTAPTGLYERLHTPDDQISPFGLCFRPSTDNVTVPFPHWLYRPTYLPSNLDISVGRAPLSEPMWFFLSFGYRPDTAVGDQLQPLVHKRGFKLITSVVVAGQSADALSTVAEVIKNVDCIFYERAKEQFLKVEFDFGSACCQHDFRPALPLILHW